MSKLWLCYYTDFSAFAVFTSELKAARYAVAHSMVYKEIKPGGDVKEQLV